MKSMRHGFFALLILPSLAHAAADAKLVNDFRSNARVLPQALINQGYRSIGTLDPAELLQDIDNIEVQAEANVEHAENDGAFHWLRQSAEWSRERQGSIRFSAPFWQKTPMSDKPVLALHESLGARGFMDNDFACSSSVWTLTNPDSRASLHKQELAAVERVASGACQLALAGGGSTGIGGGGDDFAIRGKINGIKQRLRRLTGTTDPYQRKLILDDIEGIFYLNIETNRREKSLPANFTQPHGRFCLVYDPVVSSIKVWVNDQPVRPLTEDPENGWSLDSANPRCVVFHGKSVQRGFGSTAVMADHAH